MALRDLLRAWTPAFLLNWYRKKKKQSVRKALEEQRKSGDVLTRQILADQLHALGVSSGDVLLVHSSLSKIGYVEGGPETVTEALLQAVGPAGHVLMPTSPNAGLQLDYIRSLGIFDVNEDPSRLGALTEYFRKRPDSVRSASPTEPVSCIGPDAPFFTDGHFGELTPYTAGSPFWKVAERGGKILYIGVTLANAGTSLHLLEDAVDGFKFPVYFPQTFPVRVRLADGTERETVTKVHHPEWSVKRRCDELIPVFEREGVLRRRQFGNAETLVVDAKGMLEVMLKLYREKGVTMYTPQGSD